jgi:hypothetical protein
MTSKNHSRHPSRNSAPNNPNPIGGNPLILFTHETLLTANAEHMVESLLKRF